MPGTAKAYEGDTSEIPENEHEAALLVEDIPSLWNTLFSFPAMHEGIEKRWRRYGEHTHQAFR